MELNGDGSAFLRRPTNNYLPNPGDAWIAPALVQRAFLRPADLVIGLLVAGDAAPSSVQLPAGAQGASAMSDPRGGQGGGRNNRRRGGRDARGPGGPAGGGATGQSGPTAGAAQDDVIDDAGCGRLTVSSSLSVTQIASALATIPPDRGHRRFTLRSPEDEFATTTSTRGQDEIMSFDPTNLAADIAGFLADYEIWVDRILGRA